MLRVSSQTVATEIDLQALAGREDSAARGIRFGPELMRFAEALAGRDAPALERTRQALLQAAGPAVLVDAAGVAANFQRMVRIADATGIAVDDLHNELGRQVREELDLARFATARHSLR